MATQLIKHLANCAENDAVYEPLKAQWTFDEKLIAKALQNVGTYFPHYSRHDESHSRQILVHIERLLGENIAKLTATDTWLLLEAAYNHDIGMVVTDEQLNKDFPDIKNHVEKTKHSAHGDTLTIMNALLSSKTSDASWVFTTANVTPVQANKILREIIADFYRTKHPERSNHIIHNPMDEIGLNSPRNELLPARLFGLLGKICEYHGADFKKVMELPKQQVGIGTDDCHPRFVACLLRLGDLLDLDDNRFCPVMMKMAGDLPNLSKAHHDKHLAIRHFRANSNRIEIEADCPTYESYIETTKWFGWLREEVKNQMSCWFDIVPKRDFGLLPSVGDLKAHLKDWQMFNENERPHFTLDRDRIFELLQGAGLYENKEQAMRELLQNAVDATLIRTWREHGEDCKPQPKPCLKSDSAPRSVETLEILDNYAIDVSIEKINEEGQYNYWRVTITDQGTGISRDDLKFMLEIGSSKKNFKKRAIIEQMPVWMKSSGIFGIGLHSVFLLTDEVWLETRSIDTGETLIVKLTNPTDEKQHGNVYFQIITEPKTIELDNPNEKETTRTFKPWGFSRYGCQLSFIYKTDTKTIPAHKGGDVISDRLQNHDGLINPRQDLHIIKLCKEIFEFFNCSFLSGDLMFIDEEQELLKMPNSFSKEAAYFYPAKRKDLELLKILFEPNYASNIFYYRGQIIQDPHTTEGFFSVVINLLSEEADKILSLNRNKFKSREILPTLIVPIGEAIQDFFESQDGKKFYDELEDGCKARVAAEYKFQGWQAPEPNYFCDWNQLLVETRQGIKKIEELQHFDSVLYFEDLSFKFQPDINEKFNAFLKKNSSNSTIHLSQDQNRKGNRLVQEFLKKNGFKSSYLTEQEFKIVKLSKENDEPITKEMIQRFCKQLIKESWQLNHSFLKRKTIPCLGHFLSLELKNPNFLLSLKDENSGIYIHPSFLLDLISPRMLFPLARIDEKITVGDPKILAERVHKNLKNPLVTEAEVSKKYQEFIGFLDKLMQNDPEWVERRGSEFIKPID